MDVITSANTNRITAKELRDNLKEALRKSGALDSVKAQIRKEFIDTIGQKKNKITKEKSLHNRILFSIVYHFLKKNTLVHSLSVYTAEIGLQSSEVLSEEDVLLGLNFGSKSKSVLHIKAENESNSNNVESVLDVLIKESSTNSHRTCVSSSTQTELCGPSVREDLDNQIRNLNISFFNRRESANLLHVKSIEERMIEFQRQCEERVRKDFDAQLATFREIEINKIRFEEANKMNIAIELTRRDMEADFHRRLQAHAERESESLRNASDRERQLEQLQYESRQRMQREIDDIRARETASLRKVDLETQGLRVLEARLKEAQILLSSREKELSRKEKEFEITSREFMDKAREDARLSIQSEMDVLLRERATLMLERQKFDDMKDDDAAMSMAVNEMRKKHREMQESIILKDDEIAALRLQYARLMTTLGQDENTSTEVSHREK
jgi:oral-facial-digital syndrome 1 protein